jgi:hypothetical protein
MAFKPYFAFADNIFHRFPVGLVQKSHRAQATLSVTAV